MRYDGVSGIFLLLWSMWMVGLFMWKVFIFYCYFCSYKSIDQLLNKIYIIIKPIEFSDIGKFTLTDYLLEFLCDFLFVWWDIFVFILTLFFFTDIIEFYITVLIFIFVLLILFNFFSHIFLIFWLNLWFFLNQRLLNLADKTLLLFWDFGFHL